MKLKYYLRGLGIGIICTAIIMGIALSGNKKETMTDTEIIERARLLGMVMPEEADDSSASGTEDEQQADNKASKPGGVKGEETKINADNKKQEADQAGDNKNGSKADSSKVDVSKSQNDADKGSTDKAQDNTQNSQADNTAKQPNDSTAADNNKGSVKIEIKAGEFSDTVSQKLFQAGLISDAAAFNKYLTQKGADQNLRVGVYEIPAGATQDEILDILQK
jgi:hypothetical protein